MRRVVLVLGMLLFSVVALSWSNPIFANNLPGSNSQVGNDLLITNTFTSIADSYVDSTYPTTNYGTSTQVRVDASPTVRAYVRFSVQGLTGPVSKATLRVYANTALSSGIEVHGVADNSWSETGINYSNAPALGSPLRTSPAIGAGTWVAFDVTSYVTGNGTFSFGLVDLSATALSLASREATNDPQLVVESGTTATPVPTATTASSPVPTATTASSPVPTATTASAGGGSVTLASIADAYVDPTYPATNYGTSTALRADGSPAIRSYVRFNVQGLSSAVSKATLRIYANTSLSSGLSAQRVADNTWGETTINYGNAPALGGVLSTAGSIAANTWVSFDVTSFVTGNGTFSFAVTDSNFTAISLASRESANDPQLIVQTGSGTLATATPVAQPTSTPVTQPTGTPIPPAATATPSGSDPIVLATGDSRSGCDAGPTAVANLLDTLSTSYPILFNGDATNTGAYSEFTNCFNTTYGRHKAQLKPVPGNHEYMTSGASGYYSYFGSQAGPSGKGYYSFNVGPWHVVNLNSEIDISSTSAQVAWLKSDLTNSTAQCTIAMWHRPRFSSGEHGNNTDTGAMYQVLYDNNVELLLSGHDHEYERFAPQNPSGAADSARGIRQFVLGTGGVALRAWATIRANSQIRNNTTWGALQLTLHASSYDWKFLPVAGQTFTDSGTTACH